ncbi:MAG TPA: AI-2E family transporter YdiK [Syntrophales bacterium]|nr:AI-2E family transporter YdiK [Syntrophales bacterium]
MTNTPPAHDITKTSLSVLFIGILIAANYWILKSFLPSFIWAVMIVVATWPLMLRLQAWLGGKRGFAVSVMTIVLLLLFIVPFTLAIVTLSNNADMIRGWADSLKTHGLPPPPGWVSGIPLVGPKLSVSWNEIASAGSEGLSARIAPYAGKLVTWFVDQAGSVGMMLVQFLLTVIICAILYSGGEPAANAVRRFTRRLAGQQGDDVIVLAAKAIRGVALGVVGTALIQCLIGGIGLVVCGVPAVAVLTAIMFILCIAQLGPVLVLVPAVIWLYWSGETLWGTVLLAFTIVASTLDNVLRPILIKKGADLPLLLIFAGVIGGLIAFGIIGLFIGPVVLAVTYTLLGAWVGGTERIAKEVHKSS